MTEHIQSPLPKGSIYPTQTQGEQIQAALAAAKAHIHNIPAGNEMALRVQRQIIARYEKQLQDMGADSWLT